MSERKVLSSWDWIDIAINYFTEAYRDIYLPQAVADEYWKAVEKLKEAKEAGDMLKCVNIVADIWLK